jgi:hypothetical protein
MEALLNSPLLSALIGALVGGLLTLLGTWWTLSTGFKNQRKILEDEQAERLRGAGWALIAEMSGNLASLQMLSRRAESKAPVTNMHRNLTLQRYILDMQLSLLALRLPVDHLRELMAAYSGVDILFGTLDGKWERLPYGQACTEQDARSLNATAGNFEKALRTVAKSLSNEEGRKAAGLDERKI